MEWIRLEAVRRWLEGFPGFQGVAFQLEHQSSHTDRGGIFPQGLSQKQRFEDILGDVRVRWAWTAKMSARFPGEQAQLWLDLQSWVQENPFPVEGRQPAVRLEKGRLAKTDGNGWLYEAVLTMEATR